MSTKAKGNRREHQCMEQLEGEGYLCTRSAASLGEFDIIAINREHIRLIQVKSNCWPGPAERERMSKAAQNMPDNAVVECWRYDDRKPVRIKALCMFTTRKR